VALVGLAAFASGCAGTRIENQPLAKYERGVGYGSHFTEVKHGKKLRVVLAFSGGGTRAAALAYGVLKELRDTGVEIDGTQVQLIDQVTTISSVSGGSFTAAYYGLHGDGIFVDFEERFLRRNIQGRLELNLLRPLEMLRIGFTPYTRTDLAMDIYDRHVFDGATFADLEKAGGPMLNINATDVDIGAVFTFMQPVFDMICSDLSKMRVSQAATASSAVPGLFRPLLLENHAGSCGHPEPEWIARAMANPLESRRRYHEARTASTYLDSKKRPYIFLVDGGVADNIGARRILSDVIAAGGAEKLAAETDIEVPEYLVYIVVNAQVGGKHDWDMSASLPSLRSLLSSVSGTGIYRYNFETIELLRESSARWAEQEAKAGQTMRPYVVEVAFDNLAKEEDRKFFNDIATSFSLDDHTIDRLIAVGGQLMRESPDFKRFVAELE
jgi:NTE family protein